MGEQQILNATETDRVDFLALDRFDGWHIDCLKFGRATVIIVPKIDPLERAAAAERAEANLEMLRGVSGKAEEDDEPGMTPFSGMLSALRSGAPPATLTAEDKMIMGLL